MQKQPLKPHYRTEMLASTESVGNNETAFLYNIVTRRGCYISWVPKCMNVAMCNVVILYGQLFLREGNYLDVFANFRTSSVEKM